MTWIIVAGVAVVSFVLGLLARGGRRRSPVEDYEEQQRRAAFSAALAEKAGTIEEVRLLVERGQKINAIKAFRAQANCGLREAKDAVETLEREIRAARG